MFWDIESRRLLPTKNENRTPNSCPAFSPMLAEWAIMQHKTLLYYCYPLTLWKGNHWVVTITENISCFTALCWADLTGVRCLHFLWIMIQESNPIDSIYYKVKEIILGSVQFQTVISRCSPQCTPNLFSLCPEWGTFVIISNIFVLVHIS